MTDRSSIKGSVGVSSGVARKLESESMLWRACLLRAIKDAFAVNKTIRREALEWFAAGDRKQDPEDITLYEACDLARLPAEDFDSCIIYMMQLPKKESLAYGRLLSKAIIHEQRLPTPDRMKMESLQAEMKRLRKAGHFSRGKPS